MIDVYLDAFDNLRMLRHCGRAGYFTDRFYQKTDDYQVANSHLYNKSMRWLNMRLSLLSVFIIVVVISLPILSKTLLNSVYLRDEWQFLYALGVASQLFASSLNFNRYYPLTRLHLLSAKRIQRYFFELTDRPEMEEERLKKRVGSPLSVLKRVVKRISRAKRRNKVGSFTANHH